MDLENQQRVKDAAEKVGAENLVVVLGSFRPRRGGNLCRNRHPGRPHLCRSVGGSPLGLCVYHVFEEEMKSEADPAAWEEQISMMEMVLNTEALAASVKKMRDANSKYPL